MRNLSKSNRRNSLLSFSLLFKQKAFFISIRLSFKVNTKRERRSGKKKNNNSNSSFITLGALVTGLTSSPGKMTEEMNQVEVISNPVDLHPSPSDEHDPSTLSDISSSHLDPTIDSGMSSDVTMTNDNDELSSISGISSIDVSGVIIPEEKRVTDRVKDIETTKNKTSTDHPSIPELKNSTGKGKSKRTSLKKQLQNLLKIEKTSIQDELPTLDEQPPSNNGKKKCEY